MASGPHLHQDGQTVEPNDLSNRVVGVSGQTQAQVDLTKMREAGINKLRRDLEEANIQHDNILVALMRMQPVNEIMVAIDVVDNRKASIENALLIHQQMVVARQG